MKPKYIDPQGRKWNKYICSFSSPEGKFSFDIWAISFDHAHLQLDAIKETATISGEVHAEGEI